MRLETGTLRRDYIEVSIFATNMADFDSYMKSKERVTIGSKWLEWRYLIVGGEYRGAIFGMPGDKHAWSLKSRSHFRVMVDV